MGFVQVGYLLSGVCPSGLSTEWGFVQWGFVHDEYQCYFQEISMALTRDPFKRQVDDVPAKLQVDDVPAELQVDDVPAELQVDDVPAELQEEFLELMHNSSVKDEFNFRGISEFWVKMCPLDPGYPYNLGTPFSSTYQCESGFPSLTEPHW